MKKLLLLPFLLLSGCAGAGPAFLREPASAAPAAPAGRLADALGIGSLLPRLSTGPAAAVVSETDRGTYLEQRLSIADASLGPIEAVLLTPKKPKTPMRAVIGVYDCEGGCPQDPAFRPGADLARRSYAVLSALPHQDWLKSGDFCRKLAERRMSLQGLRAYETLALTAYLRSRADIDDLHIVLATRGEGTEVGDLAASLTPWIAAHASESSPSPAATCGEASAALEALRPELRKNPAVPRADVSYGADDPDANEQISSFFKGVFSTLDFNADAARAASAAKGGDMDLARRLLTPYSGAKLAADDARRLTSLHMELGDPPSALKAIDGLLKASPASSELWLERARIQSALHDRKATVESLEQALKVDASSVSLRQAALLYQDLKEFPPAVKIFEQLARAAPSSAGPLNDLAVCEYLQGGVDAAVADLKKALDLEPGSLPTYLSLGSILAATHREAEAVKLYDSALALPPGPDPALREALSRARAAAAAH